VNRGIFGSATESLSLALGIATAGYPARRQPLNQQFDQHGRRLSLPFGWDLPDQSLHRPLYQNTEHCARVHADRARHGDCLGEEVRRVGSVGGGPLNPTDELIDGRIWSVCHGLRMTSPEAMRQGQKGLQTRQCERRATFAAAQRSDTWQDRPWRNMATGIARAQSSAV
jgi:hypothetical protein